MTFPKKCRVNKSGKSRDVKFDECLKLKSSHCLRPPQIYSWATGQLAWRGYNVANWIRLQALQAYEFLHIHIPYTTCKDFP